MTITHHNAPEQTVVGGSGDQVTRFAESLAAVGIAAQRLAVPCAFHTPLLSGAQQIFREELAGQLLRPPHTPLLSSVTNRYVAEPDDIRQNLAAQLTEPVRLHPTYRASGG